MNIFDKDLWDEVFGTLNKNLLRTFLTTLGVIFAVLILVVLLGVTRGLSNNFDVAFKGTATNSMFLWAQSTSMPFRGFEKGRNIRFTLEDAEILKKQVPEIDILAPRISLGNYGQSTTVRRAGRSSGSNVYGDYPAIDGIFKKNLVEGRFLNGRDILEARKVCVIGLDAYKLLFDRGEKAIGQYIEVNGVYVMVVGVFKSDPNVRFEGENIVYLPFSTFQKAFNSGNRVGFMAIKVQDDYPVSMVENRVKAILKSKYSIHPDDPRAIGSFDLSKIFDAISAVTIGLQGFSFFIGLFTLLAGVVAVSNILLITVKERTKEIGVRRALGATPGVIRSQILLESLVLTVFSGLIGFILSTGILFGINYLIGDDPDKGLVNPTVSLIQVVILFFLMVGLSLLIGLIPANRAIKIKPIEALREE